MAGTVAFVCIWCGRRVLWLLAVILEWGSMGLQVGEGPAFHSLLHPNVAWHEQSKCPLLLCLICAAAVFDLRGSIST
jgi:AMMECR1 domain-containing protein